MDENENIQDFRYKVFKELKKSKAFIYKINSKYYYIGSTIFRNCTKEEIEEYDKYIEEFNRVKEIESIKKNIEKKDVTKLVTLLNDFLLEEEPECNDKNQKDAGKKIKELVESLNYEQLDDIIKQYKDRLFSLNQKDKFFECNQ